ncbi:LacI family DNA-binding transcriptional regulator [Trinickia mobilis]|uniref:LacI family DNA-binding transcriptional regulator n=1 Tax=Trinickia mobilis TaxID=2816356 RepID=UPI001A8C85AB|nr:LacI family DNA-binding transcriptional regulator [Trinickia mobilis]
MKQVAELAGLHVSTVSRALNPDTRSMVVPESVARVMKAADALGYRLDPVAASLRTGRSKLIGILVPDIATNVFTPILTGAAERLSEHGYSTIVAYVGSDSNKQFDLAQGLIARRVDGLILATASRDDPLVSFCIERGVPSVLVNRAEKETRLSGVVSDDLLGAQLAVDHLVELGHRTIGHLAGPPEHSTGFLRHRGFIQALSAHGLDATSAPCEFAGTYTREQGAEAARRLLSARPDITAIVAANDLLALGAYDALREIGLNCPRDISVVGHNDMPLVDMVEPPLTTIRISHKEMGRQAADLLQQAIETRDSPARNVVLPPKLIVRGSTAAPRKSAAKKSTGAAASKSAKPTWSNA